MPAVVEALLWPDAAAASQIAADAGGLAAAGRQVALELRRLCQGDLAGMFDGPTTPGLALDGPLVVLDLSALYGSPALGLLMLCATAWLQASLHAHTDRRLILVIDEAWAILRHLEIARWLQASWKLSRQYGVSNIAVIHRLSDLRAAGAEGSEQAALAQGLLADSETRIIYGQSPPRRRRPATCSASPTSRPKSCPSSAAGVALWRVGTRSFLVEHRLGRPRAGVGRHRYADGLSSPRVQDAMVGSRQGQRPYRSTARGGGGNALAAGARRGVRAGPLVATGVDAALGDGAAHRPRDVRGRGRSCPPARCSRVTVRVVSEPGDPAAAFGPSIASQPSGAGRVLDRVRRAGRIFVAGVVRMVAVAMVASTWRPSQAGPVGDQARRPRRWPSDRPVPGRLTLGTRTRRTGCSRPSQDTRCSCSDRPSPARPPGSRSRRSSSGPARSSPPRSRPTCSPTPSPPAANAAPCGPTTPPAASPASRMPAGHRSPTAAPGRARFEPPSWLTSAARDAQAPGGRLLVRERREAPRTDAVRRRDGRADDDRRRAVDRPRRRTPRSGCCCMRPASRGDRALPRPPGGGEERTRSSVYTTAETILAAFADPAVATSAEQCRHPARAAARWRRALALHLRAASRAGPAPSAVHRARPARAGHRVRARGRRTRPARPAAAARSRRGRQHRPAARSRPGRLDRRRARDPARHRVAGPSPDHRPLRPARGHRGQQPPREARPVRHHRRDNHRRRRADHRRHRGRPPIHDRSTPKDGRARPGPARTRCSPAPRTSGSSGPSRACSSTATYHRSRFAYAAHVERSDRADHPDLQPRDGTLSRTSVDRRATSQMGYRGPAGFGLLRGRDRTANGPRHGSGSRPLTHAEIPVSIASADAPTARSCSVGGTARTCLTSLLMMDSSPIPQRHARGCHRHHRDQRIGSHPSGNIGQSLGVLRLCGPSIYSVSPGTNAISVAWTQKPHVSYSVSNWKYVLLEASPLR